MTDMILKLIKNKIPKKYRKTLNRKRRLLFRRNVSKIFAIGFNKTGTTSLSKALGEMGFLAGDQKEAEMLYEAYSIRNFKPIIKHVKTADFFQDFPFSYPHTYISMDQYFKGSKFILTVRDSPEQWYHSITNFHGKLWGNNNEIPTKMDLLEGHYHFKGFPWILNRLAFTSPEEKPYDKEILIRSYESHIETVKHYFRDRPEDLLVLNVAEPNAYMKLASFLNVKTKHKDFPWLNKTN